MPSGMEPVAAPLARLTIAPCRLKSIGWPNCARTQEGAAQVDFDAVPPLDGIDFPHKADRSENTSVIHEKRDWSKRRFGFRDELIDSGGLGNIRGDGLDAAATLLDIRGRFLQLGP
jgi:hypothetical protein